MNFVSRSFTAVGLVLVEYTTRPIVYILALALGAIFILRGLIKEPKDGSFDKSGRASNSESSFNAYAGTSVNASQ